jgi:hypothetical protein
MATHNKSNILKLRTDLFFLSTLVANYLKQERKQWLGNDEEFVRQWSLYKQLRQALIQLDSELFGQLRDISLPDPDKSNQYYAEHGMYFAHHLEPLKNELALAVEYFQVFEQSQARQTGSIEVQPALNLLFRRFHQIARQIRRRHDQRETISVQDEYDVQDLLHALLSIFFEDIRAEEWTPSYAGGSSRMDFLLKEEQAVVEAKMSRKGLSSKTLGDQLIVDIEKYQAHPDCRRLFCFVYVPEGWITNPRGIENDLSKPHGTLEVFVAIEPKS